MTEYFPDVYLLECLAVLIVRVAPALAAPLLVSSNGAQVGHFDDDGMERACEVRGERVFGSREGEAASAGVTSAEAWSRTEGQLVHGRREAWSCNPAG